jgi:type II secretory pathway pseudopilin PulG
MNKKTVTFSLVIVILVLAISVLYIGVQLNETQKKVRDLQNQVAYYKNVTDTLQSRANSLETQINDLKNPIDNLTFTAISIGSWVHEEYTPYQKKFNVTFQNVGTRKIGGVTLDCRVVGNTTSIGPFEIHVYPHQLGIIQVQETKSLIVTLVAYYSNQTQILSECNFTFTLMLDKVVFARQTVMIGP